MSAMTDIFGPPIHTYTVTDALEDGAMVRQTPATVAEAGYRIPVVLTAAAHAEVITWTRDDEDQNEDARLWDVLVTMRRAAKQAIQSPGDRVPFHLRRIPNTTPTGRPSRVSASLPISLDVVATGYDNTGAPCFTVLLPEED